MKTHKITLRYHEEPPYKGEKLIHYLRRTKNTLRALLYYNVSIIELYDLLQDQYHVYPNQIKYTDPYNINDYLNELSSRFLEMFDKNGNICDIPRGESHDKLVEAIEKARQDRRKISNDLRAFRSKKSSKKATSH